MVRLTESIVYSRTKITVESVRKLNLWGCDIDDIGLCSQMINLQILSLSMNRVKCLKPLENCMRLEELYLRKNEITSLSELEHLRDLKMLRTLWIDENPCTADNKHRAKVLRILPNLTRLDDKPVTIEELLSAAETNHQYNSNNGIDDNQRTVIDKIIPNHARIQELRSDRSGNDPEHSQQLPPKLMATSLYEGIVGMGNTDNRNFWQDFNLEMSSTDTMFHSMQDVPFGFRQQHKSHITQHRSISHPRTTSNSIPCHRKERIISAIGVLLDELDADGLRDVVDEAQRRRMLLFLMILQFFLSLLLMPVTAKTIDNKLTGMPQVTCGPENITIEGSTEELFEGVIFIKNWRRTNGCAAVYSANKNTTRPSLSISLNRIAQCGLVLRRNSETKEVEIFVVLVFSFHPNFVTAGDRSFAVHCIFQQQSFKVATKFNFIADMNTRGIIGATASIPVISLTIIEGRVPDPKLESAKLVSVGDPLMYIWHFKSDTSVYGIWVKECSVEAEDGRKMKIIENGCSLDSVIVSHVQYPENNLKAFADGLAFKFPDADDVWISCVVTTCLRKFDQFTPTNTSDYFCPKQPDCSKRLKRSVEKQMKNVEIYSTDNLVHHRLHVIDQPVHTLSYQDMEEKTITVAEEICIDKNFFAGTFAALTTAYLATIMLAGSFGLSIYRSQRKQ